MIVKDPTLQGTSTVGAASTYNIATQYEIQHISGSTVLETDDTLTGNSTGAVLKLIQSTEISSSPLIYTITTVQDLDQSVSDISAIETITTSNGGVWDINSITESELNHGSGQIIFVEQRRPIMRAANQNENIIIITEF